jgi:3'-phosphoadenosine 5'-phosphosulfate sulfotransferase (PAPS reductase)/FAD synthetase
MLVQSDTKVEYPNLEGIAAKMRAVLAGCGWVCEVVEPRIHEKLYNRILGVGNSPIHPGGRKMRWCTRSTKIDPMERWRKVNATGLTLTGLRLGESKMRDGKIAAKGCSAGGECGIPDPDERTYSPLLHWRTCHVVDWLSGSVSRAVRSVMGDILEVTEALLEAYEIRLGQPTFGDDFGEQDIQAARFGCIGCPAIGSEREPPRSVARRHGVGHPLNELYDVWFEARLAKNRIHAPHTRMGMGPIRLESRKRLFARVMDIQRRAGVVLVTPEDEAFIRDCWARRVYPRGWSEADEATPAPEADAPLFDDNP